MGCLPFRFNTGSCPDYIVRLDKLAFACEFTDECLAYAYRMTNTNTERLRLPENDPVFGGNKVFDAFQYSPAVRAAGLVFIAGQVGIRPDGSVPETVTEQIELAFKRLGSILEHLGLGFEDLVELVSYHVDIDAQLPRFRDIKERYITRDFPAWTILGVAALARPDLLVEIKAVAAAR